MSPCSYFSDVGVVNYSTDINEDPDRTYETLAETGNGVLHNDTKPSHDINNHLYNTISNPASTEQECTCSQDTNVSGSRTGTNNAVYHTLEQPDQPTDDGSYSYPDNTSITKPPSSELEYTYAKDTDSPRVIVNKAAQNSANKVVYQTLEQPEQQPDDGTYSYLDNTSITKPPASELEYTYAKDTDLPRVKVDKAAKDSVNKAVYHTLEQPDQPTDDGTYSYPDNTSITKPPASELEYTYAKDTDSPRINNINQNTPAKSPANNALYHTLEQLADDGAYSYLDNTRITKPLTSELEHTYAKDTDLPRVIVDKAAQNSANKPVYHTLEQPEQPADDGTYSYLDNTSITKPPASELEYTYAKDTDLPRINNINQNTPAKSPANNALYHTLEQPEQPADDGTYSYLDNTSITKPPPSELEYTYAKDTDSPRINNINQNTPAKSPANNALYHTLEQLADDGAYSYLDNTRITKPLTSELEHTYAKDTDLPRVIVDKAAQNSANKPVYHTLEQPEQPADDGTYSYLDNTSITKPPASELEYTYAKDTDLPRINNINQNTPAKSPANNALYHTLEQPEQPADDGTYSYLDNTSITKPPPSELEYTYAKDTDLPRININQKTPAKSPANNALYHTLEQPADNELYLTPEELNPPQAPVYSTLEEPQVDNSEEQVRIYYTVNYSPSPQNLE